MSDIYDACLDLRTDEEKYKDSLFEKNIRGWYFDSGQ